MVMLKKIVFFILILIFFSQIAGAIPIFSEPAPQNNSYIYGKNTEVFSINISETNLDTSTVRLHARVEDPTSIWTNVTTNCFLISSPNWFCNSTISNLEALVHDGNWLLYYFDGNDTSSGYGNFGSSFDPLRVRVDRSPPNITFISPKNESYSSGNMTIEIEVIDTYSSVNVSSIGYSFDNSTWLAVTTEDNKIFKSVENWDTKAYSNNQSVNIYARASDVLSNNANVKIKTTVDNEPPRVSMLKPYSNQTLSGDIALELQAEDTYSGLEFSSITYSIRTMSGPFSCYGSIYNTNCTASLATRFVQDGYQQLMFKVLDRAKNEVTSSTFVIVDNLPPQVKILSPSPASTVSGNVNVSASVKDDGVGVANVSFRIESDGAAGDWNRMDCKADYCSALWNSTTFVDGTYNLRVYSMDKLGRESSMVVRFSVVNTQPLPTAETTTTTQPQAEGKSLSELIPNFIDKIRKNPLLVAGLILPFILLPASLYLLSRREAVKKTPADRTEDMVREYMANINNIQSMALSSIGSQDINELKDKARLMVIYLRDLEKDFAGRMVGEILALVKDQAIAADFKKYLNEMVDEMENIRRLKREYLDEISRSLNEILIEEDVIEAHKSLEDVSSLIRKLKGLADREIAILSESLNRLNIRKKDF